MLHAREEQGKTKNLKCGTEFTEFLGNSVYQFLGDFQTKFTHHGTSPSAHESLPIWPICAPTRSRVELEQRMWSSQPDFWLHATDFLLEWPISDDLRPLSPAAAANRQSSVPDKQARVVGRRPTTTFE
jgi:hypothetical protein